MKRKSVAVLLILVCLLVAPLLSCTGASAAEPLCTVTVYPGVIGDDGLVWVPVVAEHCPGIAGYQFSFDYDRTRFEVVEIVSMQEPGTFIANSEADTPAVVWFHSEDARLEGELFRVILRPKAGAVPLDHGVVLRPEDAEICNAQLQPVTVALRGESRCYLFGDASGDGAVDVCDQQAIYNHLNKTSPLDPLLRYVADMNGDGAINVLDQQILYSRSIA